jgi:phospholipase C
MIASEPVDRRSFASRSSSEARWNETHASRHVRPRGLRRARAAGVGRRARHKRPDPSADVAPYFVADTDARWTDANWSKQDIDMLRRKIKYVFMIFNENRSFDHEYGTLPGVNGLFSDGKNPRLPADTPGFTQTYVDTNTGETVAVQPFRVGPEQNPTVKDSTPFAPRPRRQDRR